MPMYGGHLEFDDVAMLGFFGTFDMLFKGTISVNPENFSLLRIFSNLYYEFDLMLLDYTMTNTKYRSDFVFTKGIQISISWVSNEVYIVSILLTLPYIRTGLYYILQPRGYNKEPISLLCFSTDNSGIMKTSPCCNLNCNKVISPMFYFVIIAVIS